MRPAIRPKQTIYVTPVTLEEDLAWGQPYLFVLNEGIAIYKPYPDNETDWLLMRSENSKDYPDRRIKRKSVKNAFKISFE